MLAKYSGLNAKGPSLSLKQENFCVVLTYSIKRASEISKFHAVMKQWLRNVQKSLIHMQSCSFVNLNLLLVCCSPSPLQTLQKLCYHGNVTSHFSSLSGWFPMKIPGEFDPLSSHRPHLVIMAWPALPAGLQNFAFFWLAKTKPKRAKDARVETHSKEHPPRVSLCSP